MLGKRGVDLTREEVLKLPADEVALLYKHSLLYRYDAPGTRHESEYLSPDEIELILVELGLGIDDIAGWSGATYTAHGYKIDCLGRSVHGGKARQSVARVYTEREVLRVVEKVVGVDPFVLWDKPGWYDRAVVGYAWEIIETPVVPF